MDSIKINGICKNYLDQNGDILPALKDITFNWRQGENIGIIGESGSGKSTLARMIIGLEKPDSGEILLNDISLTRCSSGKLRNCRKKIQGVFQDASGTLNPKRSVYQNVEEALYNLTDLKKDERKERIFELMELTGIKKEILKNSVRQLSGGEQRRIALLRALSLHPNFLVLDEVTSGLDLISAESVLNLLERYHQEYDCTYLMITHQLQYAYRISDKIYKMEKGVLCERAIKTK